MAFRLFAILLALAPLRATVLIRDVNIVDVEAGRVLPHRSVLISGNEIRSAGASRSVRAPGKATVVNGAGKFLIPGLWDMHVHLWYAQ
ncbi:MAG TPA: hypothetical protein VFA04_13055, partial [Bryobacteraceae bacterium]|nr:hypothetical protein [Bryobacteraceae bacterium]